MSGPISDAKSAPADRETTGPFDESEVSGVRPYVDLGSLKLIPREGLNLRLEVEEGSGRVVAVAMDYLGSTLQVQAFASTRSQGLWHEVRSQLTEQISSQGGLVEDALSELGPELLCKVPALVDGQQVFQEVRFIGVDGPRWFLRGVIAGPAATNPEQGARLVELFRDIVVVRGQQPMPPRELMPLKVPEQAAGIAPTQR
ncbi:MAG: DUF3710 domain-containing protein [Actinomycetales bacterium]|nr:DUF3710 domain-containing protein [Actinomycetales bacterium]